MSIIQGGPGCPYFLPAMYKYMTTGEYLNSYVEDDDIPDAGVRHMIAQVKTLQVYVRIAKKFKFSAQNCS